MTPSPLRQLMLGFAVTVLTSTSGCEQSPQPQAKAETVKVLAARKDLDVGQRCKFPENLFEFKDFPKDVVPRDAIVDFKELRGRTLLIPRRQGDWITANELISKDMLLVEPPAGMLAVSVRVEPLVAWGWCSIPKNRVDLMVSMPGDDKKLEPMILLERVLVLAIDDRDRREENGKPMAGGCIIVAVTPEDAQRIEKARDGGATFSIRLAGPPVRNADPKPPTPEPGTKEENDSELDVLKALNIPKRPPIENTLNDILPAGHRAVAIKVKQELTPAAWAMLPGLRVDVLVTVQEKNTASSRVLLENVLVLASDEGPEGSRTATVALVAADVLKLAQESDAGGTFTIMLRPFGESFEGLQNNGYCFKCVR